MVRCSDGSLYTGVALDVGRRVAEHNTNDVLAATYTRFRRPVMLVYQEKCDTRSAACRREYEIKQMGKKEKLTLIAVKLTLGKWRWPVPETAVRLGGSLEETRSAGYAESCRSSTRTEEAYRRRRLWGTTRARANQYEANPLPGKYEVAKSFPVFIVPGNWREQPWKLADPFAWWCTSAALTILDWNADSVEAERAAEFPATGAPADIIAVKGNLAHHLTILA
jgi:putative endonuclease